MKYNYVTVLSNWLLGFDKYNKKYSKDNLSLSKFKNVFYLLKEDELHIGINKAKNLLIKTNISNNQIIRIETFVDYSKVEKNHKNGLGWWINQNWIKVNAIFLYDNINDIWVEKTIEEITALAYALNSNDFLPYNKLLPRTLSILPIALACQAKCKFCFSESSISYDQKNSFQDFERLEKICKKAKEKGAQRFVITGGGEPGILKFDKLIKIIKIAKKYFTKIVLISNGLFLNANNKVDVFYKLNSLIVAGLTVLSISYHHHNVQKNMNIMGIDSKIDNLLDVINEYQINKKSNQKLKIRLICVLQKSGIETPEDIKNYIKYAIGKNVNQVCFKELYVSSLEESLYANNKENIYCKENQISLEVLTEYLNQNASLIKTLPWGSPVYKYENLEIAAYTEPSVGWERKNGIARSWNITSDGNCYASLEDKNSLLII